MKKKKELKNVEEKLRYPKRPKRVEMTEEEILKRMEDFPKRAPRLSPPFAERERRNRIRDEWFPMPLVEKLRIEFFFPDSPDPAYSETINRFENELTHTFGGCSVIQGVKGLYRQNDRDLIQDRIHLLFTDVELNMSLRRESVSRYVDAVAAAIFEALNEEKILIAVHPVYHQTTG